jgi:uncharacterized protein (DUF697 family)
MRLRRDLVYVTVLAVVAAYFLIWPIWRAQFLLEIWFTEAWNSYYQDAAAAGLRLYPAADQLIVNNYPPLSFYVIGTLGKLFGSSLFAGRALSVLAVLGVGIEVCFAVRILAGSAIGGVVGALWYVAFMARSLTTYVGANDPQLAGEALMGAALVWFLARDRAKKSAEPALLLMVAAGFWKHNIIAIPLTAILWLIIRDWRAAVRPVFLSGLAATAGLVACVAMFGPEFLQNLLTPREYAWAHVVGHIGHLQWIALAFVIWAAWAWSDRHGVAARFTMLFVATALCACILQWFGDGVFRNAEFDLSIALGIGIGVAFARIETSAMAAQIGVGPTRDLMIAALVLRLLVSERQESALVLVSPEFRASFKTGQQHSLDAAAQIAAIPGLVYCKGNNLLCRLAGKPFAVDDFKTAELVATSRITQQGLLALFKERHITVFEAPKGTRAADIPIPRLFQ